MIVGSWLVVAMVAACLFTAQMVFAGRKPDAVAIAEALSIIPFWMLITPVVLRMSERAPVTRLTWPRRVPAFAGLWLVFFVGSNVLVRVPFPELRADFLRRLAFGLSVYFPGSALAFVTLMVIGHLLADRAAESEVLEGIREPRAAHLIFRDGARTFVVQPDDVDWIEAEDNYVLVHTPQRSYTVRQRIRDVESQLDPPLLSAFIDRRSCASAGSPRCDRSVTATSSCCCGAALRFADRDRAGRRSM